MGARRAPVSDNIALRSGEAGVREFVENPPNPQLVQWLQVLYACLLFWRRVSECSGTQRSAPPWQSLSRSSPSL